MTELEFLNSEMNRIQGKINDEEKKAEWNKAANDLHEFYNSLLNAGFTESQAWWFVTATVRKAFGVV